MIIRRENDADRHAITAIHRAAFSNAERTGDAEAWIAQALRNDGAAWIPQLCLIAESNNTAVGHVVCTRAHINEHPALALGPVAVSPAHQGKHYGSALIHAVIAAADAMDEPVVALRGSPALYGRFGFVAAQSLGITAPKPDWGEHFQARALSHGDIPRGHFRYASPFAEIS